MSTLTGAYQDCTITDFLRVHFVFFKKKTLCTVNPWRHLAPEDRRARVMHWEDQQLTGPTVYLISAWMLFMGIKQPGANRYLALRCGLKRWQAGLKTEETTDMENRWVVAKAEWGRRGWTGSLGFVDAKNNIEHMDKQGGPAGENRELYPITWDKAHGREWKRMRGEEGVCCRGHVAAPLTLTLTECCTSTLSSYTFFKERRWKDIPCYITKPTPKF